MGALQVYTKKSKQRLVAHCCLEFLKRVVYARHLALRRRQGTVFGQRTTTAA